jgi:hypothetical protein
MVRRSRHAAPAEGVSDAVHRPARPPVLVASVVGLALVAVGLIVLAGPRPGTSDPSGSPAGATGSTDPSPQPVIDDATCRIERAPGPADEPPKPRPDDQVDLVDLGGGRWRACLTEPVAMEVEGTAQCVWDDDRTAVRDVAGLSADAGGGNRVDSGIDLALRRASVGLSSGPGRFTSYGVQSDRPLIAAKPDGRSGAAAVMLTWSGSEPEPPRGVRPPSVVGTIRWTCAEPPPGRPGRSTGQVSLRLDAPIGQVRQVAAKCDWITTARGPWLSRVETYPPDLVINDTDVGVSIGLSSLEPDVGLWVDSHAEGAFYVASGPDNVIPLNVAVNRSSGHVRLRHARIDAGVTVRLAPGVDEVSGTVAWSCPPPRVAGPKGEPDHRPQPPDPELPTGPGRATLTFDPAQVGPLEGAITCRLDRTDPGYLRVDGIDGSFRVDGAEVRLRSDGVQVLLILVGADGSARGEYLGQVTRIGDGAGRGPLLLDVPELTFEPTDPTYVPLGGPDAPRSLALHVDFTCELDSVVR